MGGQKLDVGEFGIVARVPAACFSRIFCAAASFALASSLPLMPWDFFCYRGKAHVRNRF